MKIYLLYKCFFSVVSLQGPNQRRLYNDLLANYNPLVRPVTNDSQVLTVQLGMSLMQIMDVVRKQYLTCICTAQGGVMITHSCLRDNQ